MQINNKAAVYAFNNNALIIVIAIRFIHYYLLNALHGIEIINHSRNAEARLSHLAHKLFNIIVCDFDLSVWIFKFNHIGS